MARERTIAPDAQTAEEQAGGPALRPRTLDGYIGQRDLVEKLRISLQAVGERGDAMEHVLLYGPPGLGKTTLAHVIAEEMGTRLYCTAGPVLSKGIDLVGILTRLDDRDVIFIDEIHRLPRAVEEYIYKAMEDFRIDFTLEGGRHARTVTHRLEPFTLVGATTRPGLLTSAFRSRFGIRHHLQFYEHGDLVAILERAAGLLGLDLAGAGRAALATIAARSRGTPRVALRLLRRVRDYGQVRAQGRIDEAVVADALALEGVDALGLDGLDRRYLGRIAEVYDGGPVGIEAIAATLGEDSGTLEDLVEPYLLQIGFLARTRQGRQLAAAALEYLGLPARPAAGADPALFDG